MTDGAGEDPATGAPRHLAAVLASDDDLRVSAVPFLRAGVDRGEAVLAVVPPDVQRALRSALGAAADRVRWGEPGLGRRPMGRAFEECRGFLAGRQAAGEAARLLTENDLARDADGDRVAGYLRYEAATTALLRPFRRPWLCLYDRRRHPPALLAHVGEVHPELVDAGGRAVPSPDHVEPFDYLAAHAGPALPVTGPADLDRVVTSAAELPAVRQRVRAVAAALGLPDPGSVVVAVHEVVGNGLRHGLPPVRVRAWAWRDLLRVRVDDRGHADGLATAGYRRPGAAAGVGAGLWVVRQVADVVHTGASASGTAVELQFRTFAAAAAEPALPGLAG